MKSNHFHIYDLMMHKQSNVLNEGGKDLAGHVRILSHQVGEDQLHQIIGAGSFVQILGVKQLK